MYQQRWAAFPNMGHIISSKSLKVNSQLKMIPKIIKTYVSFILIILPDEFTKEAKKDYGK